MEDNIYALQKIPIAINSNFGDPFQPSQWNNTLTKLESLHAENHQGAIMLPTKYVPSDEQLNILASNFPNVWIFFAITGLKETKLFSFVDYQKIYLKASEKLENIVCAIRPIVPNENDKMEILLPILEMVKNGRNLLTFRGYRDPNIIGSPKYENNHLFKQILSYCEDNHIVAKNRCACIVSHVKKIRCIIHDKGTPINIELIKNLGYKIELINEEIELLGYLNTPIITKGDISFIRMLSMSIPKHGEYINSEIASLNLNGDRKIVCTSSWFNWSRQTHCVVGCWYCYADPKSRARIDLPDFGCNPKDLLNLVRSHLENGTL